MRDAAVELGVESTFRHTPVGVYFGKPGERSADPYFGGEGPARTGCTMCGNCMVGCRDGAKNTLVKNYLWLAERLGAVIEPLRTVTDVRPVDPARPEQGYAVTTERTGAWARKDRQVTTAAQVIVAGGAWGTAGRLAGPIRPARGSDSDQLGGTRRRDGGPRAPGRGPHPRHRDYDLLPRR